MKKALVFILACAALLLWNARSEAWSVDVRVPGTRVSVGGPGAHYRRPAPPPVYERPAPRPRPVYHEYVGPPHDPPGPAPRRYRRYR